MLEITCSTEKDRFCISWQDQIACGRRISILSAFAFIDENDFEDALNISELLLHDEHSLIHKAVGWALRENGKRDQSVEESFLAEHYLHMPGTMLRYAIEKFEEKKRKRYLNKKTAVHV